MLGGRGTWFILSMRRMITTMRPMDHFHLTWIALSLLPRVGLKTLHTLQDRYGADLRAALHADPVDLRRLPGIGKTLAGAIHQLSLDEAARRLNRWQAAGVRVITLHDGDYPPLLRRLDDAPPILFVRGRWHDTLIRSRAAAVVGTRSPSPQARQIAGDLGLSLAERGGVVVSGLAFGIDQTAHVGALSVPGSSLIAVLGSGVLNLYPPENSQLAAAVMDRGAVISELAPETTVSAPGLVARNRIISGLADAVIVVESNEDGGAMHAARFARRQGRPVYTFDLPASGNRDLLDSGAIALRTDLADLPF
jgi:DNA processing protein